MGSHMIDSYLFNHVVSTDDMRAVWDEVNGIQKLLDVEKALARAEAAMGIIPKEAADEICRKANIEYVSLDAVRDGIRKAGHTLVPLLRVVERACEGDMGQYIHFGATTQDVRDTAMMLQVKEARSIIMKDLADLREALADLVLAHSDTPMVGRTHGQQALPITFGLKAAVWLDEVCRHIERLEESEKRLLVGNLTGAVGTYASFGEVGPEVERRVMEDLGLGVAQICWHASRDRFAEFLNILGLAASTCGKIANEIFNLQATEVDEVEEGFTPGRVGSSTMPHKRNPGTCECIVSLAKLVRGNAALGMQVMEQEHERDGSQWRTEWILIPESCMYAGCAIRMCKNLVANLTVKKDRMRRNLDVLKGLLQSEALMFSLSDRIGKQRAHELVYELSMLAFEQDRSLKEVLMEDPRTRSAITEAEIDQVLDPLRYLGLSKQIAEKVAMAARGE